MYCVAFEVEVVLLLPYRQNVVVVGAGRTSRSARIATSSESLYLLNLRYNMPSECCVEYKLIQLYQKSSVWCFASSHTSTFELIPAVATAQPGAWVTIGAEYGSFPYRSVTVVAGSAPASLQCSLHNWWRNGSFPCDFSVTSICTLTEIRETTRRVSHKERYV